MYTIKSYDAGDLKKNTDWIERTMKIRKTMGPQVAGDRTMGIKKKYAIRFVLIQIEVMSV